jgi:hypothetical protein
MDSNANSASASLPPTVKILFADLVEAAKNCFETDLKSAVLFGSGAEGRLRKTSDLNLGFGHVYTQCDNVVGTLRVP